MFTKHSIVDCGWRLELPYPNGNGVIYSYELEPGRVNPRIYHLHNDRIAIAVWPHDQPTDEAENGDWMWYNTTISSTVLFPRSIFITERWNGRQSMETAEVPIGPSKEVITISDKPGYKHKINIHDKFPLLCRASLKDPFEEHLVEVLEMQDNAVRIIFNGQQAVLPEELFRLMIEDFHEQKVETDLSL